MTKVVHIQTGLPASGNVAYKLHQAFLKYDFESTLIVFESKIDSSPLIDVMPEYQKRISAHIYYFYHNRIKKSLKPGSYLFSNPTTCGFDLSNHEKVVNADIIYIHWAIGGFLSLKSIQKLVKTGKPVVFYLHDMWPITGGCHHSFDCMNFSIGCHFCPLFIKEKQVSYASKQLEFKKKMAENYSNIFFIAPSFWMMDNAKNSQAVLYRKVFHIPHFIDSSIYKPIDKSCAKKLFNLPQNKKIIGFGSVSPLQNPFKGGKYLREALGIISKRYSKNDTVLLIFGSPGSGKVLDYPFETFFAGRLNDHASLSMIYNAMDVFVTPSLAESFGMTALESIACGTPVVCFDVGGLKDIIQHKKNGYRAVYKDSNDLANGIIHCLHNNMNILFPEEFEEEYCIKLHKHTAEEILNL
jgi:glycosyltransferase involved in cell wall biosynthesis